MPRRSNDSPVASSATLVHTAGDHIEAAAKSPCNCNVDCCSGVYAPPPVNWFVKGDVTPIRHNHIWPHYPSNAMEFFWIRDHLTIVANDGWARLSVLPHFED